MPRFANWTNLSETQGLGKVARCLFRPTSRGGSLASDLRFR
jgi:hypothetical protein